MNAGSKIILIVTLSAIFSGCTMKELRDVFTFEDTDTESQVQKPIEVAHVQEPAKDTKKEEVKKAHHHIENTTSEVAMRWLKNGNTRFVKGYLRRDGQSQKDVKRLSTGQKPHTIVLSCSDSRVPPEIIFDQKLGELFVVRTAGETLDPTSIASMEYAVEHLGVRNLVVMGHTQCGAVKAAFSTLEGQDAGSANLNKLVQDIHPRISLFKGQKPSSDLSQESWANVYGVIKDLQSRSAILSEKIKSHELTVTGSLYHLDSGLVKFKD